ncbi:MAG TPA: DUF2752 domain-containing protein [Verrucomicrobiales bacterium]|nr:DUF2752 domain-containing protein [Verrucomicrobiales bacterium]
MGKEPPILELPKPGLPSKRKGWWKLLPPAAVLVIVGAICFVSQYEPVTNKRYYPQCQFKQTTGLDCPGCGGLRATHAITNGRIMEAFRFHPGFVLSLPILGYLFVLWTLEWRRIGQMPAPLAQPECNRPLIVVAVLFISFGIVRNIPFKPFSYLKIPPATQVKDVDKN